MKYFSRKIKAKFYLFKKTFVVLINVSNLDFIFSQRKYKFFGFNNNNTNFFHFRTQIKYILQYT